MGLNKEEFVILSVKTLGYCQTFIWLVESCWGESGKRSDYAEPNEKSDCLMKGGEHQRFGDGRSEELTARADRAKLSKKGLERLRHCLLIPARTKEKL